MDPDSREAEAPPPARHRLGDLTVSRIGYGSAKLTGNGIWGPPPDEDAAIAVLRRVADLGISFIDTADSYGPHVVESLIRRALHPYTDVVIATKAGCLRTGPDEWTTFCRPDYLRQCCEMSLRRLGVDTIDLFQLHEVDPDVPFTDQVGALEQLRQEGKIRHIGLSSVTVDQITEATRHTTVVSVQGEYNVVDPSTEPVLRECENQGLAFIPFFPLADGRLASSTGPLTQLARNDNCTPAQLALAWLLQRSPNVLPIPGSARISEVEENAASTTLRISPETLAAMDALAPTETSVTSRSAAVPGNPCVPPS